MRFVYALVFALVGGSGDAKSGKRFERVCGVLLALTMLDAAAGGFAQESAKSGTVSGVVKDESGGGIANAKVTLSNAGGGVAGKATTDGGGHFAIRGVAPGTYVLRAESETFETVERRVEVTAGMAPAALEMVLKVAAVKQSVTVSATSEYVQPSTETATKLELPSYVGAVDTRQLSIGSCFRTGTWNKFCRT